MSLDLFLDRTWSNHYTCNEFVCEVWEHLMQENLSQRLYDQLKGKACFRRLDHPTSPCIVFFTNSNRSSTHVGLFYCDKLLHLTPRGVQFVPLELIAMSFREVRYYQ